MKQILTKQDIIDMGNPPCIMVPPSTVVTPLAKTHAQARAIQITSTAGINAPTPSRSNEGESGEGNPNAQASHFASNSGLVKEAVIEEVLRAIASAQAQSGGASGGYEAPLSPSEHLLRIAKNPFLSSASSSCGCAHTHGTSADGCGGHCAHSQQHMTRAVVSVTGANAPGVAALFCQVMADSGVDIVDISQTIVAGFYTMLYVVDVAGLEKRGLSLLEFRERIQAVAESIGAQAWVMHENVLKAMHRL